jgi:hypothetical protein
VIFLRPVVVHEPNLVANTPHLREHLPKADFFTDKPVPGSRNFPPPACPPQFPEAFFHEPADRCPAQG